MTENTEQNARAAYEEAKAQLQQVVLNGSFSEAQKARDEGQALAMDFASAAWGDFQARTQALNDIAAKLQSVIEASGQSAASDALDQVTGATQGLAQIVKRIKTLTTS